jgi:TrmH family RNA methyltransferase
MEPMSIVSRRNPVVTRMRAVADGRDRTALLLTGAHLVAEALAAGIPLREVLVRADPDPDSETGPLAARLSRAGISVIRASAAVLEAASPLQSPSTIIATGTRPNWSPDHVYDGRSPLVVLACGVQDPGNLGAMVRSAEAAGAAGLVVTGPCADPYGWKAVRGSMGSALRLPIIAVADPCEALAMGRAHGCQILGATPAGGRRYFDVDLTGRVAFVVGSEGRGLPDEVERQLDSRITIPMKVPVESLNAAVTAALLVYEAARQRTP